MKAIRPSVAVFLVLFFSVSDSGAAKKRPEAPPGFAWHHVRTMGDTLLVPDRWAHETGPSHGDLRCNLNALDAGPEALKAAGLAYALIPKDRVADSLDGFLQTMEGLAEGHEIVGQGNTKRKRVRAWWMESNGLDDEGRPKLLCQLVMIDPRLDGGRWVGFSGTAEVFPVAALDDAGDSTRGEPAAELVAMLDDCVETYIRSGVEQRGFGILGCTMKQDGSVAAIGGSGTGDPTLENFVKAIDGIHGLDAFKAIVAFTRDSYEAPDGRVLESVRIHLESRDGFCSDVVYIPDPAGLSQVEVGESVETESNCRVWNKD